MNVVSTIKSYHHAILRSSIDDAEASAVAQQVDSGSLSSDQYISALVNSARASSIPALVINQIFLGAIRAVDDIDYFTASYRSALASAQALQPEEPFRIQQLNAFQALGADLAGAASVNANFLARFGVFVNVGDTEDISTDRAFIDAAYTSVFPGSAPNDAAREQYSIALAALRAQYRSDLLAKGALLGRMTGDAVLGSAENTLVTSAEMVLIDLAKGGAFQPGQLGGKNSGSTVAAFQ